VVQAGLKETGCFVQNTDNHQKTKWLLGSAGEERKLLGRNSAFGEQAFSPMCVMTDKWSLILSAWIWSGKPHPGCHRQNRSDCASASASCPLASALSKHGLLPAATDDAE